MNQAVTLAAIAASLITAQPLVDADVLEPSVQNEVDHALSVAPTNAPPSVLAQDGAFATNGMSRTDIAIKLVSLQNKEGRWMDGTNDVTKAVVDLLKEL